MLTCGLQIVRIWTIFKLKFDYDHDNSLICIQFSNRPDLWFMLKLL